MTDRRGSQSDELVVSESDHWSTVAVDRPPDAREDAAIAAMAATFRLPTSLRPEVAQRSVLDDLRRNAAELELAETRRLSLIADAADAGHSQQEIARSAGLSQPSVSRLLERMKRHPQLLDDNPRTVLLAREVGVINTVDMLAVLAEWDWTFGHPDESAPEGSEAWIPGTWDDLLGINWDMLREGEYDEIRDRVQRSTADASAGSH